MKKITDDIVVVKVGTNTLAQTHKDGTEQLSKIAFNRIGQQITELHLSGTQVIIVSSAAITAGMAMTHLHNRPSKQTDIVELQRLASIGWRSVLNTWSGALDNTVGELLITRHELDQTAERKELLHVVHRLLSHGDVPIINENDALTHEEIEFGDNDRLAAHFAAALQDSDLFSGAVSLVLLTDVDGLYEDKDDSDTLVRKVNFKDITSHQKFVGESTGGNGTGGMKAKLLAASIAAEAGIETFVANGKLDNAIGQALSGKVGTRFSQS